jgi:small subunit ribosomal protein S9
MSTETQEEVFVSVGRRKNASARVRLTRGTGKITINDRPADEYLFAEQSHRLALAPLDTVERREDVDLVIKVTGGGMTGQAGAIAHGIARALEKLNPDLRIPLKRAGHLSRDPRMKERKKSGQPGARKRFQFSKR